MGQVHDSETKQVYLLNLARYAFLHFRVAGRHFTDGGEGRLRSPAERCATFHFLRRSRILWTPRMPRGVSKTSTGLGDSGSRMFPIHTSG